MRSAMIGTIACCAISGILPRKWPSMVAKKKGAVGHAQYADGILCGICNYKGVYGRFFLFAASTNFLVLLPG